MILTQFSSNMRELFRLDISPKLVFRDIEHSMHVSAALFKGWNALVKMVVNDVFKMSCPVSIQIPNVPQTTCSRLLSSNISVFAEANLFPLKERQFLILTRPCGNINQRTSLCKMLLWGRKSEVARIFYMPVSTVIRDHRSSQWYLGRFASFAKAYHFLHAYWSNQAVVCPVLKLYLMPEISALCIFPLSLLPIFHPGSISTKYVVFIVNIVNDKLEMDLRVFWSVLCRNEKNYSYFEDPNE